MEGLFSKTDCRPLLKTALLFFSSRLQTQQINPAGSSGDPRLVPVLHRIPTSHAWDREVEQGHRSSTGHLWEKMLHRWRGRASGSSPSAGFAATLAQRPGPPQRRPARRGEAPGETPAGPSAGTAQVTQRGNHRLQPLPCPSLSPRGVTRAGHYWAPSRPRPARSLAPPPTLGPMRRAPSPHVGVAASDQWVRSAEGEGQAGAAVHAGDASSLPPSDTVSSGPRPERRDWSGSHALSFPFSRRLA